MLGREKLQPPADETDQVVNYKRMLASEMQPADALEDSTMLPSEAVEEALQAYDRKNNNMPEHDPAYLYAKLQQVRSSYS